MKLNKNFSETLTWQYGFGAATERAAKSSVTALRRQAADELDDEAEQVFSASVLQDDSGDAGVQNREIIGGGRGHGASQISPAFSL